MTAIKDPVLKKTLGIAIPFVLIPALAVCGLFVFREKSYSYVSFAIVLLSLLLFMCGFERKRTGTRKLVLTAIMTAIAVAGRFVFYALPGVNPISAVTVAAAIYLGRESGFMIGALSALISNIYAGQGVWTPFQMFSWGIIGFLAGAFAPALKKSRMILCLYGFISGAAFSLLMDVWSVIWMNGSFSWKMYLAALATALPYTLIYCASNVIFLLIIEKPFGKKLGRVIKKYGLS